MAWSWLFAWVDCCTTASKPLSNQQSSFPRRRESRDFASCCSKSLGPRLCRDHASWLVYQGVALGALNLTSAWTRLISCDTDVYGLASPVRVTTINPAPAQLSLSPEPMSGSKAADFSCPAMGGPTDLAALTLYGCDKPKLQAEAPLGKAARTHRIVTNLLMRPNHQ